jgi:hypothetical protein
VLGELRGRVAAMAKLTRGQRAGAGTVALLVLAALSLMLMVMLVLGLVAVPTGHRRSIDDGAVVELKLPTHRYVSNQEHTLLP